MKIVQYGEWKIEVDVEKTKEYYARYQRNNSQANRNFAEYCKHLTPQESAFFDAFGIDPLCCEIEHIGASRKGDFPCGGYYPVCGSYLEYPPENLITDQDLAENDFEDDRPDPRIDIGMFRFDFQCPDHVFSFIPDDIPDGFLCIRFWCQNMKWLLAEKPEVMKYEPPRFWEIHKIIGKKISNIKQRKQDMEETNRELLLAFSQNGIPAFPLQKKEIKKYKKHWVDVFAPENADKKRIRMLCVNSRKYAPFLWHIFSFKFLDCVTGESASELFRQENKGACVIVNNEKPLAYRIDNAKHLTPELLEQFTDVTVTAEDFSWTYSKTHEEYCGPYFYQRP